ncbi:metal ABC transporter substrate-binding protein [Defluviitalea saccharophila]|uniref:Metal ABC transporter substrate-binding protein n=1 Tax=Defluviitalea saccharophila TaxID=879970 RepID=A0ABZ2Y4E3_9FIRM
MKRFLLCMMVFSFSIFALSGCSAHKESSPKAENLVTVYTSIYPLYDFAKKIGQDKVDIHLIVPPGSEPHDWEPSAKLMGQMEKADILVYNGLGMESWAEKVIASINNPGLTVVNASENIEPLTFEEEEHELEDELEDEHEHGSYDPHVWLDPINAIIQSENIKNALVKVDVENKAFYENNFETLKNNLLELDNQYRTELSKLPRKEIVVSHAAFGYMANRYGLKQLSISGLSPQAEPTPSQMAKISDFIKEHNIQYIFFETLASPKLAEVIVKETGATSSVLNDLSGLTQKDLDEGKDYFSVMRENLDALIKALGE